jgi:ATP-dependent RNA helicase DeaD
VTKLETTPTEENTEGVPENDYVSKRTFEEFPISSEVVQGLKDMGYDWATPVQAATIDAALAGRDMVVRAKTGTGKTAAFAIPAIDRIQDGSRVATMLVLAPTRELAQQITRECDSIAKHRDLLSATLVGGLPIGAQEKQLAKRPELIIGTPGRVKDHIKRRNLDLSSCSIVVLDEADEMLSMGFYHDVTEIMDKCGKQPQVLLFSATVSTDTERLVARYLKDPEEVFMSTDFDQVDTIGHVLYETSPEVHKARSLLYLLDIENPSSALIFCNTREDVSTVATFLDRQGQDVQMLSGELPQTKRSEVMRQIKHGEVRYLVATDVAARGIDISELSHVVNYSLPFDATVYLHRIGRTGRIGKSGTAISLVGGPDQSTRKILEGKHNIPFEVRVLPDPATIERKRAVQIAEQIRSVVDSLAFESFLPTARALKDMPDGDTLVAAALRVFFTWERSRHAPTFSQERKESRTDSRRDSRRDSRTDNRRDNRRDSRRDNRRDSRNERRGDKQRPRKSNDRREQPRPSSDEDIDALLIAEDGPPEPKQKRPRRRKRKGQEEPSTSSNDDLDALLSTD